MNTIERERPFLRTGPAHAPKNFITTTVKVLLCLMAFLCAGCAASRLAYIQDGLVITPPLKQEVNEKGYTVEHSINGTLRLRFTDSRNKVFDAYIERRIGMEREWGTYTLNGLLGQPRAIRISKPEEFESRVLRLLLSDRQIENYRGSMREGRDNGRERGHGRGQTVEMP